MKIPEIGFLLLALQLVESQNKCMIQGELCNCNDGAFAGKSTQAVYCEKYMNYTEFPSDELRLKLLQSGRPFSHLTIANKLLRIVRSLTFVNITIINLYLPSNQIEEIEVNTFLGQTELESLDLAGNKIKILYCGSFYGLSSLSKIALENQKLSTLMKGTFEGLDTATWVRLHLNNIRVLEPETFIGLNMVETLEMPMNNLQLIKSNALIGLTSIIELNFKLYCITDLESLAFNGLVNLTSLDLTGNFLKTLVKDTFFGCVSLRTLKLNDNKLKLIEKGSFKGLIKLSNLNLSNNFLSTVISYQFEDLETINLIDLSNNNIMMIESNGFYGKIGQTLKHLNLTNNRFEKIYKHFFEALGQLITLDLSFNFISSIESRSFNSLKLLTKLDLSNNCIFKLGVSLFTEMTSLVSLNLNENVKTKLILEDMVQYPPLINLSLSNNYLSSISLNNPIFTTVKHVDLSNSFLLSNFTLRTQIQSLRLDNSAKTTLHIPNANKDTYKALNFLYLRNFSRVDQVRLDLLNNIIELDLSDNDITGLFLFFNTKTSYSTLKRLTLQKTKFNFSISQLTRFSSMSELDLGWSLSNNTELSGKFSKLLKLKLNNNNIRSEFIEKFASFFNLYSLNYLDLSYNQLEYFPSKEFTSGKVFKSLNYLNLRGNMIKEFNMDFIEVRQSLEDCIDFGFNSISQILVSKDKAASYSTRKSARIFMDNNNSTFENASSIMMNYLFESNGVLDFSYNQINSNRLTSITFSEIRFTHLNFSNNNLTALSLIYFNTSIEIDRVFLRPLKHVDLSWNRISFLDNITFESCVFLNYLNMSHNTLSALPSHVFSKLRYLEYLDLSCNQITQLPPKIFSSQLILSLVNLSSNLLNSSALSRELFEYQSNLIELDLSSNLIEQIDQYLFQNLTSLMNLYLHANPIRYLDQLYGLDSIVNIYTSSLLFTSDENVQQLIQSVTIKPLEDRKFTQYFKPVYVVYASELDRRYNDNDCQQTINLASRMILLNLRDDSCLDKLLSDCQSYSEYLFTQIQFKKNKQDNASSLL